MEPFAPGILHPTDFSEASRVAFAHALAIALAQKAKLTLINASQDAPTVEDWRRFPSVRGTLEDWGLLEAGSSRSDVFDKLAIRVKKVTVDDSPVDAITDYLREHPSDLMVLATQQRSGLPRVLRDSVSGNVAHRSGIDALFVPEGSRGFVSPDDGSLSLKRILVPVDVSPDPAPTLEAAAWAAHWLGDAPVQVQLLHVGDAMPEVDLSNLSEVQVENVLRQGDPVDEILAAASEWDADMVMMSTDGRDGLLDIFRGSHAERVVRGAPCPVAAISVE
jgi:nucleotide-binding universal stress UspA family protein